MFLLYIMYFPESIGSQQKYVNYTSVINIFLSFLFQSLFNQQEPRVLLVCVPWTAMILVPKDQMTVKTCQQLLPYNGFKKKL